MPHESAHILGEVVSVRLSLHELALQRLQDAERPLQPLNRLCLVGAPSVRASVWQETALRAVAAEADAEDPNAPLTGLLLVLPTGWLHFVEGSLPSLSAYLALLQKEEAAGGLTRIKVASCMDDVPARTFGRWNYSKLDASRNNYTEVRAPRPRPPRSPIETSGGDSPFARGCMLKFRVHSHCTS